MRDSSLPAHYMHWAPVLNLHICTCQIETSVATSSSTQHRKTLPTRRHASLAPTEQPPTHASFSLSNLFHSTDLSTSHRKSSLSHPTLPTQHGFAFAILLAKAVIVILLGCIKSYLRMDLFSISLRGTLPGREPIHYWKETPWPH